MNRDELYKLRRKMNGVEQLQDTIAKLEAMRISPRAAAYGGSTVQTSPKGDVQPDNIAKLDKLIGKYNGELRAILHQVEEFETIAKVLDDKQREIMRAYFLQGKTWERICVDVGLTYRRLMQIRNAALDAMFGPMEGKPDAGKLNRGGEDGGSAAEGGGDVKTIAEGQ